jgi:hypothetical protein
MMERLRRIVVASALAGSLAVPAVLASPAAAIPGSCLTPVEPEASAAGAGELDPQEYVYLHIVYGQFLRRSPSDYDLAYWTPILETQGPPVVVSGIANSEEAAYSIVACGYQQLLGRSADLPGLAYWAGVVHGGLPIESFYAAMANSAEFRALYATADDMVDDLYGSFLGRSPVQSEVDYWTGLLESGAITSGGVAHAVMTSDEAVSESVVNLYEQFLDRAADPAGHAFWTARVKAVGLYQTAIEFIASAEAYARAADFI